MTSPTSALLAFFSNREEAESALSALRASLEREGVRVVEAATVTLKPNARIRIDVHEKDENGGNVIEQLFPYRIQALPAVGRQADAAASHFSALGLDKNLLKEIGENLAPTSAALVAVIAEPWIEHAGAAVGGTPMERFPLTALAG